MSTFDLGVSPLETTHAATVSVPETVHPLHRLAEVRRLQGVTRRTIARRMNVDIGTVKQQEQPTSDLNLSTLYQWQEVLEVPVAELLADSEEPLSVPVLKRARMLRLMKTVMAIIERAQQPSIRRMGQTLADQLIEVMPELSGISPWHAVGRRRTQDELGSAALRRFSPGGFSEMEE